VPLQGVVRGRRDVVLGVGRRSEITVRVVAVRGVVSQRVVDQYQEVHRVIVVFGPVAVLVNAGGHVAGRVVLEVLHRLVRRPLGGGDARHAAVSVVPIGGHATHGVRRRGE